MHHQDSPGQALVPVLGSSGCQSSAQRDSPVLSIPLWKRAGAWERWRVTGERRDKPLLAKGVFPRAPPASVPPMRINGAIYSMHWLNVKFRDSVHFSEINGKRSLPVFLKQHYRASVSAQTHHSLGLAAMAAFPALGGSLRQESSSAFHQGAQNVSVLFEGKLLQEFVSFSIFPPLLITVLKAPGDRMTPNLSTAPQPAQSSPVIHMGLGAQRDWGGTQRD